MDNQEFDIEADIKSSKEQCLLEIVRLAIAGGITLKEIEDTYINELLK